MSESRALAIIPQTIDEIASLAERLSKSTLLPKSMQGKMPDVLVTIMAGQEMGLSPMASLRSFHVIEGKPVMSSDGMVAVILGSGKAVYFDRVEEGDGFVTYETLRVGSKTPRRCTWTRAMAKKADLLAKANWINYERAMLASRAKAELARDVYPDVLAGCYTDDEIGTSERPTYTPITRNADAVDAEVVGETLTVIEEIDRAPTAEALGELTTRLAALTGKALADARARYKARVLWFREQAAVAAAQRAADDAIVDVEPDHVEPAA